MLEVMIAILTITAFSIGTLQLMAFTALYKVRAERQAKANFWIQEDFEDVKYLASTLDVSRNPNGVNVDNHDPDRFSEIYPNVCSDINQGYAIELRRRLPNAEPPDSPEFDPDDPSKDYAIPADNLPAETAETLLVATREIVGKDYSLYRTFPDGTKAQSAHPHRLRIEYKVKLADSEIANDYQTQERDERNEEEGKFLAKSSVEVVPDASFECP
ncbi:type 4 pilin [Microcystis aeruginosa BLCCF158]|uniref:Type 4 pilin n=1 Tax=Microcystis aeruginosa BLCC-F158 TaxID=2755316 RepID=A0A841V4S5_MICAE|nr:type 4 pilin [Microcystis aeruginosa]MBC1196079.1 type 4 pilin [Microcystis aeruginosa BLCC-F158]